MQQKDVLGQSINKWLEAYPLLKDIIQLNPVFWNNPELKAMNSVSDLQVDETDMIDAEARWFRFAPFLEREFPETNGNKGIIESPLYRLSKMKTALENHFSIKIPGKLYMKADNELPIAGSIKARGGIYEVLAHAERLALENGMISEKDTYELFATSRFKQFFRQYTIAVGSTGNLGLSIGIISAALGFKVKVHMSADAKQWKKSLLTDKGVTVLEYEGDFSQAVACGREISAQNPDSYFVDDEHSRDLFLGYSVAALRLKKQLDLEGVIVDREHPLFVYIPCGVGGAPGGITFGLRQVFGDYVHCFFVEPTHSPGVLVGLLTGKYDKVSVQDFGIDNLTEADGLAVGRPSRFATAISAQLIDGIYTIEDEELFKLLAMLHDSDGLYIEPSAAAGFKGPILVQNQLDYFKEKGMDVSIRNATHIIWATGGDLVPEGEMKHFYEKGKKLLG